MREKCSHHLTGQNTDSKIFVYVLIAGSSTKLLFPHPFYLTGGSFFFFIVESQKQLGEQLGGEEKRENVVVLTFLLDSVSLFTMTSRWNLLTLGEYHLSSICTAVGMENHLLKSFKMCAPRSEANWLK